MKKDFPAWHNKKSQLDTIEKRPFFHEREIWWCRLGVNVGSEQDGGADLFLRPVVVMRGFGSNACLVVPLTTSTREHPLRIPVGDVQGEKARANISQMRTVDTRRLVEKVGFLDERLFQELKKRTQALL